MSYEVTATRRRPQHFDDLIGQEFVAETLKNSIKSGKIAHAYLFSGPRGCGKTSTARILAKALNCQNGPTDCPCGECSNCREITKGSSLDVIEIDGASNTSVENIRQIKDEVLFPPNSCRYKIYIIDEVHMLSTSAFNALLKTIEEPPPYVIFIFATTELQKVPATIKSRCQQFNFRLVAVEKIKECLAQAASELGILADDEALFWIARESTGSMRDAYTLFDQVVAFSDGHITYEGIRDKLGLVGVDRLNSLFDECAAGNTDKVILLADSFLQGGISIEQFVSNCADYLRSLMLIKSGVTREALLGNLPERYSRNVLAAWNSVQIERALSLFLQLYRDIRYSLSPRYELELAFSRLCWLSEYVSQAEVKKAVDAAHNLLVGTGENASSGVKNEAPVSASAAVPERNSSDVQNSTGTENSAAPAGIPPGLPQFSMLSELNRNGDSASGVEPSPFHEGGPLPPEKSVVQGLVRAAGVEFEDAAAQDSSADDGWADAEVPPDGDYPDPDVYAELPDNVGSPGGEGDTALQLEEFIMTADGRKISVAQLRGSVTAGLSLNDGFTASALDKTSRWTVEGDSVSTELTSSYEFSLLQKKIPVVSAEISKICGRPMSFSVSLAADKAAAGTEKTVQIPPQVQLLCNVFKGTIVSGRR